VVRAEVRDLRLCLSQQAGVAEGSLIRVVPGRVAAPWQSVRDITSILIPGEEVVFSIYEGPSAAAVRHLNERAGVPVSRIVEAITIARD